MNKRGQSMIEYALIAILVIMGIVTMGPYVLRSVGAHFKLWDSGVQDSFTENINQSSVVPTGISTNCSCNPTPGSCGVSGGPVGSCGPSQREIDYDCIPQGCNGAAGNFYCVNDNTCCTTYYPEGCGSYPCPASGCAGAPTAPPASNNCYYGQEIMATACATLPIQCSPSATCPIPACQGILSPGTLYCATGTMTPPSGLLQNYNNTYVANCPGPNPCAVYCDASQSYFLNAQGTSCLNQFVVAPCVDSTGLGCARCNGGHCTVDINRESFSMCAGPTAVITGVNVTDVSSPVVPPGCNQPQGHPGETCQVTAIF